MKGYLEGNDMPPLPESIQDRIKRAEEELDSLSRQASLLEAELRYLRIHGEPKPLIY